MLAGLTEIAQRAGVQKQAVGNWHSRHDTFPEPIATLRTGAVWWWPEVRAWLEATGRSWDKNLTVEEVNASDKRAKDRLASGAIPRFE